MDWVLCVVFVAATGAKECVPGMVPPEGACDDAQYVLFFPHADRVMLTLGMWLTSHPLGGGGGRQVYFFLVLFVKKK